LVRLAVARKRNESTVTPPTATLTTVAVGSVRDGNIANGYRERSLTVGYLESKHNVVEVDDGRQNMSNVMPL
jgi:hypothetical protein